MGDPAEKQMGAMVKFIQDEARAKVAEVEAKAHQEFSVEKQKILTEMNDKAMKEYTTHIKKIETQRAIARSTSINKARLTKVAERAKYLEKAVDGVQVDLIKLTGDQKKYKELLTKLIAQGCLKLLEAEVQVRCRACDKQLVQSVLNDAEALYFKTLQQQAQADRPLKLSVDAKSLPPPPGPNIVNSCLGGVTLVCHKGLIVVDNTLDARLRLVMEQDKPHIRKALFPN